MKFLADMNVSRRVVERLHEEGFDIVRVPDIMDCRATDVEIIAEARKRGAVAISHDQDFTAILATTGATQPSLINLRVSYVDVDRLVRNIVAVVQATATDLEAGAIVTLNDGGIQVHLLPIR